MMEGTVMGKAFRPMCAVVGTVLLLMAISPQSMAHQDAGVSQREAEPVLDMYVGRLNESSSTTRGRSAPPDDRTERVARDMVDLIERRRMDRPKYVRDPQDA